MKKLLLSLVVLVAALSFSACSESTAVSEDGLTDYHCIHGITYKNTGMSFSPFNSVEVFLLQSGTPGTYKVAVSHNYAGQDGYFNFDMVYEPLGYYYKLTAAKGDYSGKTDWFYWGGGSHEADIVLTED